MNHPQLQPDLGGNKISKTLERISLVETSSDPVELTVFNLYLQLVAYTAPEPSVMTLHV